MSFSDSPNARSKSITAADLETYGVCFIFSSHNHSQLSCLILRSSIVYRQTIPLFHLVYPRTKGVEEPWKMLTHSSSILTPFAAKVSLLCSTVMPESTPPNGVDNTFTRYVYRKKDVSPTSNLLNTHNHLF